MYLESMWGRTPGNLDWPRLNTLSKSLPLVGPRGRIDANLALRRSTIEPIGRADGPQPTLSCLACALQGQLHRLREMILPWWTK